MIRAALAAILISIFLTACGGGGGGESSSPQLPPSPPTVRTTPLRVGYFGIDGDQIRETADHVTYVHAADWGEPYWNTPEDRQTIGLRIIAQLQEAKARGVKEAWVSVGFLLFDTQQGCISGWRYVPRATGLQELAAFRQQLEALDLYSMVTVLYPVDEPELHCLDDKTLTPVVAQIKSVWPAYTAVIYGDTVNYPGLSVYDLVGKDKYGDGAGVLQQLPPITALQKWIVVPGGASPWRNDPQPFFQFAHDHANVYAVITFTWFDRGAGQDSGAGVRSNGMAPIYRQMACNETEKC